MYAAPHIIENSMGLRYSIDKSKNFLYQVLKFCLFLFSGGTFIRSRSARDPRSNQAVAKTGRQLLNEVTIP